MAEWRVRNEQLAAERKGKPFHGGRFIGHLCREGRTIYYAFIDGRMNEHHSHCSITNKVWRAWFAGCKVGA